MSDAQIIIYGVIIAVVIFAAVLLIMAVMYAFIALLTNPFSVGVCRFIAKSVDDEAEIREVLHLYLEKDGYEVAEASDGVEAMEKLRKEKSDLVILDMTGKIGYIKS